MMGMLPLMLAFALSDRMVRGILGPLTSMMVSTMEDIPAKVQEIEDVLVENGHDATEMDVLDVENLDAILEHCPLLLKEVFDLFLGALLGIKEVTADVTDAVSHTLTFLTHLGEHEGIPLSHKDSCKYAFAQASVDGVVRDFINEAMDPETDDLSEEERGAMDALLEGAYPHWFQSEEEE